MMKPRVLSVVGIVAVVSGIAGVLTARDSDESRIRGRVRQTQQVRRPTLHDAEPAWRTVYGNQR